jgi:hypothetical protein
MLNTSGAGCDLVDKGTGEQVLRLTLDHVEAHDCLKTHSI